MFFRRRQVDREIRAGYVFRRICAGHVVETARVLSVSKDVAGIPHVRFQVHFDGIGSGDEQRTLSLSSFSEMFQERVTA